MITRLATTTLLVLAVAPQVFSADKQLVKVKDWTLIESMNNDTNSTICTAQSESKWNLRGEKGVLQITAKKSARNLVELLIRTDEKKSPDHAGFTLETDDRKIRGLFASVGKTVKSQFFWMVPQDSINLIKAFIATPELHATSVAGNGSTKFTFSTKGLNQILLELRTRCMNNVGFVNGNYEGEFRTNDVNVNLQKISVSGAQTMRKSYLAGLKLFLEKRDNRAALAELRKQFAIAADEYEQLGTKIANLTETEIPKLEGGIKLQQTLRANSEKELPQRRAEIPGLKKTADAARAVLDKNEAIVSPIRGEYHSRTDNLNRARADLDEAKTELSEVRAQIDSSTRSLNDLESELSTLESRVNYNIPLLNSARSSHQKALNRLNQFNRGSEISRLRKVDHNVSGDTYSYEQAERAIGHQRNELSNRKEDLNKRNAELATAEAALQKCKGNTTAPSCSAEQTAFDAADKKAVQCAMGNGGLACPAEDDALTAAKKKLDECKAKPTIAPSCPTEEQAVTTAKANVKAAKDKVEASKDELERREKRLSAIDNIIDDKVDREERFLREEERETRERRDELDNRVDSDRARINLIANSEIPTRRQLLMSQTSQESSLVKLVYRLTNDVDDRSDELLDFRVRTGWDTKKANLDRALADFEAKDAKLRTVEARERELVQIIEFAVEEQPRLENKLKDTRALLERSTKRRAELKPQIQPYLDAKATSDAKVAQLEAGLSALNKQYRSSLGN